ncbi:GrlR family regulatory protein [Bradyrhizobium prioriisuperbiae]|uniref:GrlR family regulatory protein n=1 Tax=Bradyrhizobium prioriisuperbiae TaxID=2854389 RepID=UPI0028E28FEC|nr:GrlR family regulatory protein [Bradyrhizobium prioritasuperba]
MREGFYKVEFSVDAAVGRSVMYVHAGQMLGGNSGFAHYGSYHEAGGETITRITSHRHNLDPNHISLLGSDIAEINARGRAVGDAFHFQGGSPQMPGAVFRSVMTRLDDEELPAADTSSSPQSAPDVGNKLVSGLYSIHLKALDGVDGALTGVMLLHDGCILGGDAFFYYLGSYTSAGGKWKGGIVNQEHTPAKEAHPVFGGHEVGIGFSGTFDPHGATLEAAALIGKRSIRLTADLKLMRPA